MQDKDKFTDKPKEGESWDVAIIGSGPAGLTAAIYTTRGAASTLIAGGENWGGQLRLTTAVDNFPGFPGGVQGPELMELMKKQSERFGAEFLQKNVEEIDVDVKPFKLKIDGKDYAAKSIIVATGADTRWLGVPGEEKLRGRGVSSCAPCDAPFFKNKKVAVVGGGDSAMEEALVLTKYASSVTIIHRRDSFKASAAMKAKVEANKTISVVWDTVVEEFLGENKLEKLKLKNVKTGQVSEELFDGTFVAIGHVPMTDIFRGKIELDEKGYVKKMTNVPAQASDKTQMANGVGEGYHMATSVEGIFVAGDVHDLHYKQAITAAGFGCMAGMEVLKYLDKNTPGW